MAYRDDPDRNRGQLPPPPGTPPGLVRQYYDGPTSMGMMSGPSFGGPGILGMGPGAALSQVAMGGSDPGGGMGGGGGMSLGMQADDPFGRSEGLTGLEKAALIAQVLGAAGGVYGQYQQGRQQDRQFDENRRRYEEEQDQRRRSGRLVAPYLQDYLGS